MSLNEKLHYAFGSPSLNVHIKAVPEDFIVNEVLGFELSGSGEHYCLLIEKRALNTNAVVKILSKFCHVAMKEISYAGIKDRQAVTRQWFSVRVGLKKQLSFDDFNHPALTLIEITKNSRKIKRGSHKGNAFKIRLTNINGDLSDLEARANTIKLNGVPNYFAHQRFGKNQDNVSNAKKMFMSEISVRDRFLKSLYISAARAYLFNLVLSKRVQENCWNKYVPGDVMSLAGSQSSFTPDEWDQVLIERLESFDIHPSGPMWGQGELASSAKVKALELSIAGEHKSLCDGLSSLGLKQERRALRLCPQQLEIYPEDEGNVVIEFALSKGTYATSVLRELVNSQPEESRV